MKGVKKSNIFVECACVFVRCARADMPLVVRRLVSPYGK
jgi:hypothetical protein